MGVADTLCSRTPCCPRTPAPRSDDCCPDDETFVFPACAVRSHHGCPSHRTPVQATVPASLAWALLLDTVYRAGVPCCRGLSVLPKICAVKVFKNYHTGKVERGAMSCEYWSCVYRDAYYNTSLQGLPRWAREFDTESHHSQEDQKSVQTK